MSVDHPEWAGRVTILTHDLRAPISDGLRKRIGPLDYIISMASLPNVWDSIQNPAPFIISNVQIAVNMLEFARVVPHHAFLQISTDEIYGPTDGETFHKEWSPMVPSNPYSASKASQEMIAISYWRTYGIPLIIVNLMNNFGEMQAADKFPAIVQRKVRLGETVTIHGTPETVGSRFYIHSRNSADAFLFLLRDTVPHKHEEGVPDKPDRYNIVGDKQITNLDMAKLIAEYSGRELKYKMEDFVVTRPGHDRHYGLDGAKLAALGWKSPKSLEDSLRETVRWYEAHPRWLDPH
jgi:dTDP-glucose 4,6-dehydratase